MGMIFTLDDEGNHVSTGKYPYPAGQVHVPEWGPWQNDTGGWLRQCDFGVGACDLDEWTSKRPEGL